MEILIWTPSIKKVVRNPYPLSIIGNTIHKLEVFQYDTALYINMGYYTIQLSTQSISMTTIVAEFVEFRYNQILMSI